MRAESARPHDRFLWTVLGLAVVLRLFLILHPDGPLVFAEHLALHKSWDFWHWGRPGLDLDPHTAGWPALSFYLAFASQLLLRAAGTILGVFLAPGDFEAAFLLHRGWFLATTQLVWTALYVAGMVGVYRWGRRVAGTTPARIAMLGLALDPLLVEESLTIGPDLAAFAFMWLGLAVLARYEERRADRDLVLASVCCGLGMAAKYYPAMLALAFLWSLARVSAARGERGFPWKRALLCAAGSAAVFLATSPMLIADWRVTRRDVNLQMSALGSQRFGQGWHGSAWLYYVARALPQDLGWGLFLVAAAGAVWLAWKRPRARPAALVVLALFAVFGEMGTVYPRYALPALPLAWMGAGWLLTRVSRRFLPAGLPRLAPAAAALAAWAALTVAPALRPLLEPDSRAVSAHALSRELPRGADILREYYTPDLPTLVEAQRLRDLRGIGALSARFAAEADTLFYARQVSLYLSSVSPEESDLYYDPRYVRAFDAVLVSSGISARYQADPSRFPRQVAFYDHLRRFTRHAGRWGGRGMQGPMIDLYLPDSTRFVSLDSSWQTALATLPPARSGSPIDKEAAFHDHVGALLLERGHPMQAAPELERALELNPRLPSAYNNLALAYTESDRPELAEKLLLRALELRPDNANAEMNLVALQISLEHYPGMLGHILHIARSAEVPSEVLLELGRNLEQHHRPMEAAAAYEAAAERGRSSAAWLSLGRVRESVGYWEGAEDSYLRVLESATPLPEARERALALLARLEPAARERAEARLKVLGAAGPGAGRAAR